MLLTLALAWLVTSVAVSLTVGPCLRAPEPEPTDEELVELRSLRGVAR